jgi:hypothetical protein
MISLKALLGNENNQNLKRRNRIEKARHICRAFLLFDILSLRAVSLILKAKVN